MDNQTLLTIVAHLPIYLGLGLSFFASYNSSRHGLIAETLAAAKEIERLHADINRLRDLIDHHIADPHEAHTTSKH